MGGCHERLARFMIADIHESDNTLHRFWQRLKINIDYIGEVLPPHKRPTHGGALFGILSLHPQWILLHASTPPTTSHSIIAATNSPN